jgi:hypothetical protein
VRVTQRDDEAVCRVAPVLGVWWLLPTRTPPSRRDEEGIPVLAVAGTPVGSTLILSDRFRRAVGAGDIAAVPRLFREDAVFLSPVVCRPYAGRNAALKVLEAAERVREADDQGRITEPKVMLRPASALQVVGVRIAEEFARPGLASSA